MTSDRVKCDDGAQRRHCEAVVSRDRLVVVTALTAVIALSWAYLLTGAGMGMSAFEMTRISLPDMAMMTPAVWTPGHAVLIFSCGGS